MLQRAKFSPNMEFTFRRLTFWRDCPRGVFRIFHHLFRFLRTMGRDDSFLSFCVQNLSQVKKKFCCCWQHSAWCQLENIPPGSDWSLFCRKHWSRNLCLLWCRTKLQGHVESNELSNLQSCDHFHNLGPDEKFETEWRMNVLPFTPSQIVFFGLCENYEEKHPPCIHHWQSLYDGSCVVLCIEQTHKPHHRVLIAWCLLHICSCEQFWMIKRVRGPFGSATEEKHVLESGSATGKAHTMVLMQ